MILYKTNFLDVQGQKFKNHILETGSINQEIYFKIISIINVRHNIYIYRNMRRILILIRLLQLSILENF